MLVLLLLLLMLLLLLIWEEDDDDDDISLWNDLRLVGGATTMLTMGGELLKADLKAVAEMVVGDKRTPWVVVDEAAGEVDDRPRLLLKWVVEWVVDEDDEVDDEVDKR